MKKRKIINIDLKEHTLKQASEEFCKHNKVKGLSVATQRTYKGYIDNFIEWVGEDKSASFITTDILEDYIVYKSETGTKPVSVATIMRHLRTFINFCIKREYMSFIEVTIPKYQVELKEPYTKEEMTKLLARPKTDSFVEWRTWSMVNYFYGTGQRLSTVINIKVSHLDFDNNTVKLEWNKDKIQKYMPLSSAVVKVLKEYIKLADLNENDWLFPDIYGNQLKPRGAEQSVATYNRRRGVQKTSIHLLRHVFAKTYIINGGSPVKLQKLLNHKTIDMTMRYVNLYSNDISSDLDLFNPLDTFNKDTSIKRRRVIKT